MHMYLYIQNNYTQQTHILCKHKLFILKCQPIILNLAEFGFTGQSSIKPFVCQS